MRLLLLALLLLAPSITQAQDIVRFEFVESQERRAQIDTLVSAMAAVDSAQQRYHAEHGTYAWHPDSLVTVGLKLSWNRGENTVMVLPWYVEMTALGRKDTPPKPQSWKVILVFQNVMCWYPEKEFGPLPPHVDISAPGLPGLACGLDPR